MLKVFFYAVYNTLKIDNLSLSVYSKKVCYSFKVYRYIKSFILLTETQKIGRLVKNSEFKSYYSTK